MDNALSVLVIEDSPDDAYLVVRELTKAGYSVRSERVSSENELVSALSSHPWDVAISDFTMPGFSGTAALAIVRQRDPELPFVFVSGTIGEDTAVAAMRTGADDYVLKGNFKRLVPAVERALRDVTTRRARRRAEERVTYLAFHDVLTDLANRSLFQDRLERALASARRTGEPLAVLVMDLDGFKAINDSLGHYTGDRVLQQVASRLQATLREMDTLARLGGDEFGFVLPGTGPEGANIAARKFLRAASRPIILDGHSLVASASVGIASFPDHGTTPDILLQKADIAMYAAKSRHLECAAYSAERDQQAHNRLMLITELQEAIEKHQFICEYQPLVDLNTGKVAGVEALARWRHPQRGVLPPSAFIELAEQTGQIGALTMRMIETALGDWREHFAAFGIPVAVNLSARNLQDPELPDWIGDMVRNSNVPPGMLRLEITENFLMSDPSRAAQYLTRLHEMGISLAIDDFGAGYSSLRYLRHLPVDVLKIDQSFVSDLKHKDDAIVRCAIDLAHNLGLSAVAEGVETATACHHLNELQCDFGQGYLFARPRSPADTIAWMDREGSKCEGCPPVTPADMKVVTDEQSAA